MSSEEKPIVKPKKKYDFKSPAGLTQAQLAGILKTEEGKKSGRRKSFSLKEQISYLKDDDETVNDNTRAAAARRKKRKGKPPRVPDSMRKGRIVSIDSAYAKAGGFSVFHIFIFFVLGYSTFQAAFDLQTLTILVAPIQAIECIDESHGYTVEEDQCFLFSNSTGQRQACTSWNYASNISEFTLRTDYNLVCGRKHYTKLIIAMYFFGRMLAPIVGILADKNGRKLVLKILAGLQIFSSFGLLLVNRIEHVVFLRFLMGVSGCMVNVGFTLLMELLPSDKREFASANFWTFHSLGLAIAPSIVGLEVKWELAYTIKSLSTLILLLVFFVPESPRWQIYNGNGKDAILVILQFAKWRQVKNLKEENIQGLKEGDRVNKANSQRGYLGYVFDMFNSLTILKLIMLFIFVQWSVVGGRSFTQIDASVLSQGKLFSEMAIVGGIDLPGGIIAGALTKFAGRKRAFIGLAAAGGVFLIGNAFSVKYETSMAKYGGPWVMLLIAVLTKICIKACFCAQEMFRVELMPTSCRAFFCGMAVPFGNLATVFGIYQEKIMHSIAPSLVIPNFVLGVAFGVQMLLTTVMVGLMAPETRNKPLPTVPAEVEWWINYGDFDAVDIEAAASERDDKTEMTELDDLVSQIGIAGSSGSDRNAAPTEPETAPAEVEEEY